MSYFRGRPGAVDGVDAQQMSDGADEDQVSGQSSPADDITGGGTDAADRVTTLMDTIREQALRLQCDYAKTVSHLH